MRLPFLIFLLFTVSFPVLSQMNDIPIGGWKSYLPTNNGFYATESPDYVFYVSSKSITRFDKNTLQPTFLTTIDGLSDINVKWVAYNEQVDALLVIYENSNIDIIYQDQIINVNDILRSTTIQGDKTITNIYFEENNAFLSANFGLVVLDMEAAVIRTSVRTPVTCTDFTVFDENYLVVADGVIHALPVADFFNFQYWSLWENVSEEYDAGMEVRYLEKFNGKLFLASERNLLVRQNGETDTLFSGASTNFIPFLQEGYNYLMAGIGRSDGDDHVRFYKEDLSFLESSPCHGILRHSLETSDGRIFYGDAFGGYRYAAQPEAPCEFMFFEGPASAQSGDLLFKDKTLVVAGGGPNRDFQYTYSRNGFYFLNNGEWTNVTPVNTPELRDPYLYHFFRAEFDPENEIIYIGTYWGGIVKYQKGAIEIWEDSTSCLQGAVGDNKRERVSGLLLDENKDLWISNYAAPEGLKVIRDNGACESFDLPVSSTLADIVQDDVGFLWIRVQGNDAGLLVMDPGERSDPTDDRFKVITSGNSALPNNEVTCLTVNRDGNIWVGTSDGLILFACGTSVFDFNCSSQPIVDPDGDGIGDFLLDDVEINTVITDGANRVWVGTNGGIIVLSPSGSEQIMQFDTDNSPLFSNSIVDFAYDEASGLMYIGTSEGLMAYRTSATKGGDFTESKAYAYPNPVYPNYDGPIAIKGLAEDAIVKITDLKGRILFETEALGGQAIWNGTQWNGDRVSSGVYLAWISERTNFNPPDGAVIKIVVIK